MNFCNNCAQRLVWNVIQNVAESTIHWFMEAAPQDITPKEFGESILKQAHGFPAIQTPDE